MQRILQFVAQLISWQVRARQKLGIDVQIILLHWTLFYEIYEMGSWNIGLLGSKAIAHTSWWLNFAWLTHELDTLEMQQQSAKTSHLSNCKCHILHVLKITTQSAPHTDGDLQQDPSVGPGFQPVQYRLQDNHSARNLEHWQPWNLDMYVDRTRLALQTAAANMQQSSYRWKWNLAAPLKVQISQESRNIGMLGAP